MGQDNQKLQKIRDYARTAVLEKEDSSQTEIQDNITHDIAAKKLNLFSKDVLQDTEIVEPEKKQEINPKSYVAPKYSINTLVNKQVENQEKKLNNVQQEQKREEAKEETKEEIQDNNDEIEEKVETLYNSSLTLKQTGEEVIEKELNTYSKKSNNYKFRFNLLTSVFCCLLAILGGWVIGNTIEIASTNSQIVSEVSKGEEYQVNIIEYLTKIGKLDDNVNQTPPNPEDGSLLPIDEIIPITPQPLEDTTAYEQESNWFDKICNWLKNLFGG